MSKALFDYYTGMSKQEVCKKYPDFNLSDLEKDYDIITKGIITTEGSKISITLYALGYCAKSVIIPFIDNLTEKLFCDLYDKIKNEETLTANYVRGIFVSINKKSKVNNYIGDTGIFIEKDRVYYKDKEVNGKLIDQILKAIKNKKRVRYLINFLDKLMKNPSYHIHTRLFDFLDHNDIEITEDGDFIAFKNLNLNFTDIRTGTMNNSIGKFVSMPRNLVDDNDRNTCSVGLHVCSKAYLPSYCVGGVTVKVKVNPTDVCSIPIDYDNAKMRTCGYKVIEKTTKNAV